MPVFIYTDYTLIVTVNREGEGTKPHTVQSHCSCIYYNVMATGGNLDTVALSVSPPLYQKIIINRNLMSHNIIVLLYYSAMLLYVHVSRCACISAVKKHVLISEGVLILECFVQ